MNTCLVALSVLTLAAAGKPPPPAGGSTAPKGGSSSSSTAPAPLAPSPGSSSSSSGGQQGLPAGVTIKPGTSMVSVVETLYKKQQFEAADVVLGLALNNPETTPGDKVQLHVLEGMLRMESFQEPQARKAFTEAFNLDRNAVLPDFAPPATRQLFLDVKATMPLVTTPQPTATGTPVKKREPRPQPGAYDNLLPWIPIGVGGAVLIGGGGLVVASRVVDGDLKAGAPDVTTADGLRTTVANGKLYQTAGYTMVGVGGAVLIGGLIWKLAPDVAPLLTINVAPSEHGVAAVVSGSLP